MATFASGQQRDGSRTPLSASLGRRTTAARSYLLSMWALLWVMLLGRMLYLYFVSSEEHLPEMYRNEGILLVQIWLLALSFPCGFLWMLVGGGLVSILPSRFYSLLASLDIFWIVVTWLGLFACSYLQWFQLIPWIVRRLRQRGSAAGAKRNPG